MMLERPRPGLRDAGKANILIVDDRPEKRLVFQAILEDLRQVLITANSGEEALKQVLERDFAVILLDVNMPGLDGLETAALIRSRKRSAHVPIIFITADLSDEIHSAKGYSLGAVDYIVSPVVPEILRTKVKVFVDLYLLAEQAKRQAEEHVSLAEERAARAAAEQANRRSAFLAAASAAMGSLDFDATARELPRLAVPFLADIAAVTLLGEDERELRTEIAWHAPGTEQPVHSELPTVESRWLREVIGRVMMSGRTETFKDVPAYDTAHGFDGPLAANPVGGSANLTVESLAVLPLTARGRKLGALALGLGPSRRRFDDETLAVAADLAARAATALDNARLYRKIQEEDRRKNEFLAMLAHELRNPLAPISNAVHVLQREATNPERLAWARDVIGRQLRQLVRLVDDLLDVSRITRGKIQLRMEPVDVAQVVTAAVETSRPFIDGMEHVLDVQLPKEPLHVRADAARLAQVVANLLTNAAKYTDKGGRIDVSVMQEGAEAVFRVRDTGMGIPKEALSSIFELFTQVDRTLDRARGGLGIGLTLVRRLVEMQGGSVQAFSAGRDQGSEFTVRLPAMEAERRAAAAEEIEAPAMPSTSGVRVLVVDDNRDVAESTAMLLRMVGCEVHVAYDGDNALRTLPEVLPQAVLLDIGLPGMNGYQVAEQIRADPRNGKILLVAVSGYGQDDHRQRSKSAGFDYHMVKPIDPAILTRLLAPLEAARRTQDKVVSLPRRRAGE